MTETSAQAAVRPFDVALTAKAHRPVYRMHRYFARRPYNLFAELIEHFTQPGDLVVDPFMGGGVTLVEGTERSRRVIGFDTNPLAGFVTRTELLPLDVEAYAAAVQRVTENFMLSTTSLYETSCRKCTQNARVNWYEHSIVVTCSSCKSEFAISDGVKAGLGTWSCPACSAPVKAAPSADAVTSLVRLMVECERCGTDIVPPNSDDLLRQERLDASRADVLTEHHAQLPDLPVPDNNMQRESALHKKGIFNFQQFFTTRQLSALAQIRLAIDEEDEDLRPHLLLAFSSTLRFANRMVTRNTSWRGDRPLEWVGTGFWLPTVYLDANLDIEFERRAAAVIKGKRDFNCPPDGGEATVDAVSDSESGAAWAVEIRSSTHMPLRDQSVDAIITDPPYGSYVHYADMSNFWNVWLPKDSAKGTGYLIDTSEEAVVARKRFPGAKDANDYGKLLQSVFEECYRILKAGGAMVLTFNNREPRAWSALLVAALRAGFRVPHGGVHFQPGVANYRHTARTRRAGSVHGDFVFTFLKAGDTSPSDGVEDPIDPLDPSVVTKRLQGLVAERPLTSEELMREFYMALLPDLLTYLENIAAKDEDAERHLLAVDGLDVFNSERRERLLTILDYSDGHWTAKGAL